MEPVVEHTTNGLRHIASVIVQRWVLIVGIVLISLILGGIGVVSASTSYTATSEILIDQPSLTIQGTEGFDTVQKLTDLMTTFSHLVVSDSILQAVIQDTGVHYTVAQLRPHVGASVVLQTLVLSLHVDLPKRAETSAVANAYVSELRAELNRLSGASTNPATRYTTTVIQAPQATLKSTHKARDLSIAFVLGLGFALIVAFSLERARPVT